MLKFKQFLSQSNNGFDRIHSHANEYTNSVGLDPVKREEQESNMAKQGNIAKTFNLAASDHPEYKKRVFNAYHEQHPEMIAQSGARDYEGLKKAAYSSMAKETQGQYDTLKSKGMNFHYHGGENDYANSDKMREDLHSNNHLHVFKGGEEHDMLGHNRDSEGLTSTEKFRAVHDAFGHGMMKNGFGPKGEETAWHLHSQMYSPLAKTAMSAETRGQNSYVNYSGVNQHIQDKSRELQGQMKSLKDKGQDFSHLKTQHHELMKGWEYAPNKSVLLPPEMNRHDYNGEVPHYLKDLVK